MVKYKTELLREQSTIHEHIFEVSIKNKTFFHLNTMSETYDEDLLCEERAAISRLLTDMYGSNVHSLSENPGTDSIVVLCFRDGAFKLGVRSPSGTWFSIDGSGDRRPLDIDVCLGWINPWNLVRLTNVDH